ncbi:MAG: 50S ribosomal protein L10 [Abditibacteriota bacterium]|nr:50S ribosomal protein L10 [Abditibacteriota bacterium]MBP5718507.1 50S ribosomal protein L10 [Abditibacteriota bacterium]
MSIRTGEPRPEKVAAINEIKDMLSGASAVILTDYQGLDVKSISDFRKKLHEAGAQYKVIKNNLFILAVKDTVNEPLGENLAGPTGILYTEDDPVAAAKVLQPFTKGAKKIGVKGGVVDGTYFDEKQVMQLASIPSKQELYAKVVGGLQAPITGLVGTLQQMISGLVFTLQAVADAKSE